MGLTCNIDAKGRRARLVTGIVQLVIGVVLLFALAIPRGGTLAWVIVIAAFVGGAFTVFEARAGWCAFRAMGFKTRI